MNDTQDPEKANSNVSRFVLAKREYKEVPIWRRQEFCSALIASHVVTMLAVGFIPILFPLVVLTTLGVLVVCFVTITGPVYMNQLEFKSGDLMRWGLGNKIAAILILSVSMAGFGYLLYRLCWAT